MRTELMTQMLAPESELPEAELLICVTCKTYLPTDQTANPLAPEDETRPGARLYEALIAGALPKGLRVVAVECLSNCTRGCTVALRGGNRWSYVYGNLNPDCDAEILRDGAARYQAAADGLVPWRERSQHFRKNCIARIPPVTLTKDTSNV
jgi:predicted metal-binding protein